MLAILDQQSARWLRCWHGAVKGTVTDEAQPLQRLQMNTAELEFLSQAMLEEHDLQLFLFCICCHHAVGATASPPPLRRPTALCLPTP